MRPAVKVREDGEQHPTTDRGRRRQDNPRGQRLYGEQKMRTAVIVLIGAVASAVLLASEKANAADKVPIFVKSGATADGFTDPSKDRQDSTKDLLKRLKDSDVVRVVDSDKDAVAVVEVLDRNTKREVNVFGAQNKSRLTVRLTAGDYSTEFAGESSSSGIMKDYRGAAKSIVKQLEAWVKANHDRLSALAK
jgi:hypothetical protein